MQIVPHKVEYVIIRQIHVEIAMIIVIVKLVDQFVIMEVVIVKYASMIPIAQLQEC